MDYSKYIDHNAPIDKPIRFNTCPFCKKRKKAFVVIPKDKGFLLWCHRCHDRKWIPRGKRTPLQIKNLLLKKKQVIPDIQLPSDFSNDIPAAGKVWLHKYGMPDTLIKQMGIGYSEKYNRVIIPCFNGEELIFYQGRYIGNHNRDKTPKYITRTKLGSFHWVHNPYQSNVCVLVEDTLSAIKVGNAGYAGVSLFGSYIRESTVAKLAEKFDRLVVWLDLDKLKYATKSKRRLSSLGYSTSVVVNADLDPKDYSFEDIVEKVENVLPTKQNGD